jgi:hypothetical protein
MSSCLGIISYVLDTCYTTSYGDWSREHDLFPILTNTYTLLVTASIVNVVSSNLEIFLVSFGPFMTANQNGACLPEKCIDPRHLSGKSWEIVLENPLPLLLIILLRGILW